MKKQKLKVVQDPENEVTIEVLAESIKAISEGVRKLLAGPLSERCLVLLIQSAAPSFGRYPKKYVSANEIRAVLEGIENLERVHLKKKTATHDS